MKIKNFPNITLFVTICILIVIGILALATSSVPLSMKVTNNPNYYLFHQLLWGLLPGLLLGFVAFKIPLHNLKKWSLPIFIGAYILMLLVFVPALSKTELGATRWLSLGFFGSLQPSEVLKIAMIIYLAAILNNEKQRRKFISFIIISGLVFFSLFLQNDMGTLIALFSIAFIMFFCSKTPIKQTLMIFFTALAGFIGLIFIAPHRIERLYTYLHPGTDTLGVGYHINQALISVGSGGLFGSGLGFSIQKFGFLPQSISDSIFAIFAEETGFAGCLVLIILFLIFFYSSLSIARRINDEYLRLLVIGIGSWIIVQAFVNIGAMLNLVPLTGIPLPFISYGGSHLIAELIGCGMLLNASLHAKG
ncbi:MAG: FtsW/RodA/SpoVE family cell cycle protein [Candidatus Pacebacteria bacterium]|nr:FtsW/RodA/SpoVE family cell cycle protein [Candidatus Paceibacterota bacterium]